MALLSENYGAGLQLLGFAANAEAAGATTVAMAEMLEELASHLEPR